MAKVVTPIDCRIEAIGKPRESSYQAGQYYRPTLFIDLAQPPGTESAKIWKNLSEVEAAQLVVGDRVQLIPVGTDRSGRPKHNIVPLAAQQGTAIQTPAAAPVQRPMDESVVLSTEQKRDIADYLHGQMSLLAYVNQQTRQAFDGLPEETLMKYCLTLYLSAQRKFKF